MRGSRPAGWWLGTVLLGACLPAGAAPTPINAEQYLAQLVTAEHLTEACGAGAAACDSAALPADAQVRRAGGGEFRGSWLWLREAVGGAKTASAKDRVEAMRQARGHLVELAAEAGEMPSAPAQNAFREAQGAAAKVLARGEFQTAAGPTWLDRQFAKLQDWFLRLLTGMDHLGSKNPWLAPLMEWTCFLLAAGGLVFFVRRSLMRGALRIALGEGAAAAQVSGRDTTDWVRQAEEHRARAEWREGIHCLYWAAIASLESRRAWRPNPTRTPREYLRLLPLGSGAERALAGLNAELERAWYGQREAGQAAFEAAERALAAVAAADLKRDAGDRTAGAGAGPTAAGVGAA